MWLRTIKSRSDKWSRDIPTEYTSTIPSSDSKFQLLNKIDFFKIFYSKTFKIIKYTKINVLDGVAKTQKICALNDKMTNERHTPRHAFFFACQEQL